MFGSLQDRLAETFKGLRGKGRLSANDVEEVCRDLRIALLEADVALPVVRTFVARVKERAIGTEVSKALNPAQQVLKIVDEELTTILGGQSRRLTLAKTPPTVIMLAGLQGAGKTTLAGKLAHWLRGQGHQPVLVAADLQRPGAVEQLTVAGQQAGVAVFAPEPGDGVGDPVTVARSAMDFARAKMHDIVIVDTAGRLGVDEEMLSQARAIRDVVSPQEILFVLDAMTGQDAVTTSMAFLDAVGFTGVVLTKLDGDARGGAALSVREVTGQPVLFASTGEKLADFEVFHPDRMSSRILGMGDLLSLIEQAERAFDDEQKLDIAQKAASGDFTLEDFLEQMQAVQRMGSLSKMLGMLPGLGDMRSAIENLDDSDINRIAAIIQSMTPAERRDPALLNASRRARIAAGSGRTVTDVNQLVDRFGQARKMMKQMTSGRGGRAARGLPGLGGLPGVTTGGGRPSGRTKARSAKGRSGNPAKRAAQDAARAAGNLSPGDAGGAAGAVGGGDASASPLELPAEFKDLLKGD